MARMVDVYNHWFSAGLLHISTTRIAAAMKLGANKAMLTLSGRTPKIMNAAASIPHNKPAISLTLLLNLGRDLSSPK
jgi:hypothetical protein